MFEEVVTLTVKSLGNTAALLQHRDGPSPQSFTLNDVRTQRLSVSQRFHKYFVTLDCTVSVLQYTVVEAIWFSLFIY